MHVKEFGELCEMEFAVAAMKRGMIVSKPLQTTKYDLIVDNRKSRLRVQVKATRYLNKNKYEISISHGCESKKLYNKKQIDFFAIYIQPEDLWYFIPVDFINCAKIGLNINSETSKYKQFKNAWHLIE